MRGAVHIPVLLAVLGGVTLVLTVPHSITEECNKMGQDPCRCKMDSGEIIDLTPLDSSDYLKPRFMDIAVTPTYVNSTDLFSWNPCTPFCERHCEGAATCQNESTLGDQYFTIGKHNSANFTVNLTSPYYNFTNKLTLSYDFKIGPNLRTSVILLLCDENATVDDFIVYGEKERGSMYYYFEIISKHVCPQNDPGATPAPLPTQPSCPHPWETTTTVPLTTNNVTKSTTPSPPPTFWDSGWKMWVAIGCLSVVVLFLIYFVIGLSINLIRGRKGMAVVPHYLCWLSCCKCCKSPQRTDNRKLLKDYSDDIS